MVGTHPQTQGGIASVVNEYRRAGLFDRLDCTYVVTHRQGGILRKLAAAVSGWFSVCVGLTRCDAPLVHILLSSRGSTWRKAVVCLIALAAGRPYILHVHGSEFMQFHDRECGPTAQAFIRFLFHRAHVVLALSEEWRESLARLAPQARIEVLPNAVALPASARAPCRRNSPCG
jgi:hypothetical protein